MGVPKKHHTKSKVGRRRSHQRLKPIGPMLCPNCRAPVLPHRVCGNCGSYARRSPVVSRSDEKEEEEA